MTEETKDNSKSLPSCVDSVIQRRDESMTAETKDNPKFILDVINSVTQRNVDSGQIKDSYIDLLHSWC